ncbi:MAG: carotenoid biosynthesis protein [Salibacteraceae bacterium]
MKASKANISIVVLIIFHVVGIGGILFGDASSFLHLTPLNSLLTLAIILFNHIDWKNAWVFAATFIVGFSIEVIGVNFGWPFGEYVYGDVLGWKVFQTPLIIGVNWLILLYASIALARRFSLSQITTALLAAAIMVVLDYLIEPVAIRFNFWTWKSYTPPLTNYLAWFGISALLAFIWERSKIRLNTKIALAVYAIEIGFFGMLNLLPQ